MRGYARARFAIVDRENDQSRAGASWYTEIDEQSMIEGKKIVGDEQERRGWAREAKARGVWDGCERRDSVVRGRVGEDEWGWCSTAINCEQTTKIPAAMGGACKVAMVEIFAALRGHPATLAQAAVTEKQEFWDPIKPPCTTLDGVNKPVIPQREQREENGDEPTWGNSTAYAPSR
ncbi:hypothetical protein DFH06DRAFT_1429062 [Mycena polygramma]|nr:hypothetical protein DFH06DRAFT_1429062 [Mycena polygramma]